MKEACKCDLTLNYLFHELNAIYIVCNYIVLGLTCILLFLSGATSQGSTNVLFLLPCLGLMLLGGITGWGVLHTGCLSWPAMTVVGMQLGEARLIEDNSIVLSRFRLCEYSGVEPDGEHVEGIDSVDRLFIG